MTLVVGLELPKFSYACACTVHLNLSRKTLSCRIIHAWQKKTLQREEPFSLQFSSFFLPASVSSLLMKSL